MNQNINGVIPQNSHGNISDGKLGTYLISANQGGFTIPPLDQIKVSNEFYLTLLVLVCLFFSFILAMNKRR